MISLSIAQYYKEKGYEVPESNQFMVPMSLREKGDLELYNSILGMTIPIPIRENQTEALMDVSNLFDSLKTSWTPIISYYGLRLNNMIPSFMSGTMDKVYDAFHSAFSNVPGPMKTIYWDNSELRRAYCNVNIGGTCGNFFLGFSYANTFNLNYGCDTGKGIDGQRMIDLIEKNIKEFIQMRLG